MQNVNPYAAPISPARDFASSERRWRRTRLVSGIIVVVALMAGVMFTVIGMVRAFNTLAASEDVDPNQLAEDISTSLSIGVITVPVAVVAFSVCILATVKIWRIRAAVAGQSP
jgi:biopolymer transport protein ExbB/TolQ